MPWRKDRLRALDVRVLPETQTRGTLCTPSQRETRVQRVNGNYLTTYAEHMAGKFFHEITKWKYPLWNVPSCHFSWKQRKYRCFSTLHTVTNLLWIPPRIFYRFKVFVFCFKICTILFQSNNKLSIPLTVIKNIRVSPHTHLPLRVQKGNKL